MRKVCGLDECGRGALAGPLVAAAVSTNSKFEILPADRQGLSSKLGLRDSKKLTPQQRNNIYGLIKGSGAVIGVEIISARQINNRGIGWANKEIFRKLIKKIEADKYIVDGNLKVRVRGKSKKIHSVVKADTKIPEVMAASIVAKIFRDRIMNHLHQQCPKYGWRSSKGYGTKYHIVAIREHGVTKYHRWVFVETALKNSKVCLPTSGSCL